MEKKDNIPTFSKPNERTTDIMHNIDIMIRYHLY